MPLIPEEHGKPHVGLNFAPMIDFLFLMLALFATLAVTRASLHDSEITLVKAQADKEKNFFLPQENSCQVNISISKQGKYKWVTDVNEYPLDTVEAVQTELSHQYALESIPRDKTKTTVFLYIDKDAPWDPIAQLIFGIRELGFDVSPIYTQ